MRFDLLHCPLPDNSVDAVIILNVLEHVEKDNAAVAQIFRILKPGGIAVIEVPAGPELFDNYDRMLMHYRRYEMNGLKRLLTKAGFKIEHRSHLGCFIYPGFWLVKQISRLRTSPASAVDPKAVTTQITTSGDSTLLKFVTNLELSLGNRLQYPFGIRCLVTGSKP